MSPTSPTWGIRGTVCATRWMVTGSSAALWPLSSAIAAAWEIGGGLVAEGGGHHGSRGSVRWRVDRPASDGRGKGPVRPRVATPVRKEPCDVDDKP